MTSLNITGISIMLGMPVHRDIPWQTVRSLMETQCLLQSKNIALNVQMQVGSSIIEAARSKMAHVFLESDCDRLFWVDSDMSWQPTDFLRLVALSTVMPVVGALYPAKKDPPVFMVNAEQGELETNEYGCIPLKGMGLGFTIVQRHVMEALAERAPKLTFPDTDGPIPHIFRCDVENGLFRGEDMAFFSDIRALGHQVFADPTITLGHIGSKEYTGSLDHALVSNQPRSAA